MRRSMIAAAPRIPDQPAPIVYKNNSDGKGNSYGCHENYMMDRAVPFARVIDGVVPHFVSRTIFTGSGKVGVETPALDADTVHFQISQRAEFFEEIVGLETTLKRPIVNTRDEPHADPKRFRRLHVIVGDANLSEIAILLKVGTTAIVLAMVEDDAGPGPRSLPGRPGAGPAPGLGRSLPGPPARPGRRQHRHRARTAVGALRGRPQVRRGVRAGRAWATRARWVPWSWATGRPCSKGSSPTPPPWPTPWTGWPSRSSCWPTRTATNAAGTTPAWPPWPCSTTTCAPTAPSTSGWACAAWSPWPSPTYAVAHPPPGTRAWFRGTCLARWPEAVVTANWDSLVFDIGTDPLRRVPMMDPLKGTAEHTGALLAQSTESSGLAGAAQLLNGREQVERWQNKNRSGRAQHLGAHQHRGRGRAGRAGPGHLRARREDQGRARRPARRDRRGARGQRRGVRAQLRPEGRAVVTSGASPLSPGT